MPVVMDAFEYWTWL